MKLYLYSIVIIIVAQLSVLSDEALDKKALNDVNKLKWLVLASLVGSVITFISTLF
jgi:hypothetical protein